MLVACSFPAFDAVNNLSALLDDLASGFYPYPHLYTAPPYEQIPSKNLTQHEINPSYLFYQDKLPSPPVRRHS